MFDTDDRPERHFFTEKERKGFLWNVTLLCRRCKSFGPERGKVCNHCRWENTDRTESYDKNELRFVDYDREWFEALLESLEDVDEDYAGPCVYMIRAGSDGPIKIGFSHRPAERLKSLQSASPAPLGIMRLVQGDRTLETSLHRYLCRHRLHGEWFEPGDEVLELISE